MHLGLIGGIGPASTAFYYRHLAKAYADAGLPMDLTIVHAHMPDLFANMIAKTPARQAEIFESLTKRLAAAGAEAVAVTSLAGHFCINEFKSISPLPVIDAIPALNAHFQQRGLRKLGLLATKAVMESRFYGGIDSAELIVPEGPLFDEVHNAYVNMATRGWATDEDRAFFFKAGASLSADAVLLGGTDFFLAFEGHDCGFPVIDCAEVHIAALFEASRASIDK
ncbi:MAG: aspartate/glutamate racemase family protein [Acidobacteria bacterium]|nr:aspartate/glutamate racemase family protein [Acidobacteriota bacterium]